MSRIAAQAPEDFTFRPNDTVQTRIQKLELLRTRMISVESKVANTNLRYILSEKLQESGPLLRNELPLLVIGDIIEIPGEGSVFTYKEQPEIVIGTRDWLAVGADRNFSGSFRARILADGASQASAKSGFLIYDQAGNYLGYHASAVVEADWTYADGWADFSRATTSDDVKTEYPTGAYIRSFFKFEGQSGAKMALLVPRMEDVTGVIGAEAALAAAEAAAATALAQALLSAGSASTAAGYATTASTAASTATGQASAALASAVAAQSHATNSANSASASSTSASAASTSATAAGSSASAANTSALAAAASSTAASGSASAANTSAVSASGSASTATTQASLSSTYATNSSNSATAAAGSATTATTQAGIATTQATSATASASTATTQASLSSTYAGNASTSATAASGSATAAAGSATTATTQAGIATTQATSATSSASTATTQASLSSTYATNSSNSATAAAGSATTATTQAGIATTQATSATSSASTATTQAGLSSTYAGNASTSATAAAGSATAASGSAATATTQAGIATTQAATSTAQAALASTSATLAASVGINSLLRNPGFDDYPSGTAGQLPTNWVSDGSTISGVVRVSDPQGGYGVKMAAGAGVSTRLRQDRYEAGVVSPGQYCVIEVDVILVSGTFDGSGIKVVPTASAGTVDLTAIAYSFKTEFGAGVVGQSYTLRKLVQMPVAAAATEIIPTAFTQSSKFSAGYTGADSGGAGMRDGGYLANSSIMATGNDNPPFITADLGSAKSIGQVGLGPISTAHPDGWGPAYVDIRRLRHSLDNATWTTAVASWSGAANLTTKYENVNATARYVRFDYPTTTYVALGEFRIFSPAIPGANSFRIIPAAHDSSFVGGISVANEITFLKASMRPATEAEIRDLTVLSPMQATVAVNSAAIATIESAAAFYEVVVAASGGTPAIMRLKSGSGGSGIDLFGSRIVIGNPASPTTYEEVAVFENGKAYLRDSVIRRLRVAPRTDSTIVLPPQLLPKVFLVADGDSFDWESGKTFGAPPSRIEFDTTGIPLAAGEIADVRATTATATSCVIYAKKVVPGTQTARSDTGASDLGSGNTPRYVLDKSQASDAYNGYYEFEFNATIPRVNRENIGGGDFIDSYSGTVSLWANSGSGFVKIADYAVSDQVQVTGSGSGTLAVTSIRAAVAWATAIGQHGGKEFGVGGHATALAGVRYTTQTAGTPVAIAGQIPMRVYPPLPDE